MVFLLFMKTNATNVIDLAGVLVILFSYARSQESKKTRNCLSNIGIRYTQEQFPANYYAKLFQFFLFSSLLCSAFSLEDPFLFLPPNACLPIDETQYY